MVINELKCIEALMHYLICHDVSLETEILSAFDSEEIFENTKKNLFNYLTINTLIASFTENPSFSLEEFLNSGTIPNMYPDKTAVPNVSLSDYSGYKDFYKKLIAALKSNNYIFDEDNNIYISMASIEATIPQIWLYRLSQASKRENYDRVYLYNKNKTTKIRNKEELLEYLRSTKSFLVRLSTPNPNADYNLSFSSTVAKVKQSLKGRKETKVDDIINLFKESIPKEYTVTTSKCRLKDEYWLIRKAEQLGEGFYGESLQTQEAYLNKWIIDRVNSNTLSREEAQKYILLANTEKVKGFNISDLNTNETISGLFILYMTLLSSIEYDLSSISLSAFKIKAYLDEQTQNAKLDYRSLSREIVDQDKENEKLTQEAVEIFERIKSLDILTDFAEINKLRARYEVIANRINVNNSREKRQNLESQITSINDVESIAFDNERIISLINQAIIKGQIYIEGKDLVIVIINSELSTPVFKATININKLMNLIEDINLSFEEPGYIKR